MTVCAKCRHLRPVDSRAPAWQCPACGVAYAKASTDIAPPSPARPLRTVRARSGRPWRSLLIVAALAAGLWWGHQASLHKRAGFGLSGGGDVSGEPVTQAAA